MCVRVREKGRVVVVVGRPLSGLEHSNTLAIEREDSYSMSPSDLAFLIA